MVEYCEEFDKEQIAVYSAVSPGRHVVEVGEDCKQGSLLFKKGTRIRPQEIGALAAEGVTSVKVFEAVKVFIISTGDELVSPGCEKQRGQIYDINTSGLTALAEQHGFHVCGRRTVRDEYEKLKEAVLEAKKSAIW